MLDSIYSFDRFVSIDSNYSNWMVFLLHLLLFLAVVYLFICSLLLLETYLPQCGLEGKYELAYVKSQNTWQPSFCVHIHVSF